MHSRYENEWKIIRTFRTTSLSCTTSTPHHTISPSSMVGNEGGSEGGGDGWRGMGHRNVHWKWKSFLYALHRAVHVITTLARTQTHNHIAQHIQHSTCTRKMHFVFSVSLRRDCDRQNNGYDCQKTKNCYKFLLVYQLQYCAMHSRKIVFGVAPSHRRCRFSIFHFISPSLPLYTSLFHSLSLSLSFSLLSLVAMLSVHTRAVPPLCFHCLCPCRRTMKLWKFSFITQNPKRNKNKIEWNNNRAWWTRRTKRERERGRKVNTTTKKEMENNINKQHVQCRRIAFYQRKWINFAWEIAFRLV